MCRRNPVAPRGDPAYPGREIGAEIMSVVAFDTLKFAQTLRDKARVPQDQAEGIAQAFADATGEQIATKTDLKETELRLDAKIAEVKAELLLTKWMMGFVLAFQVAIFAKLFMH